MKTITLSELMDKIRDFDEVRLLELLNIQSTDIVDRFEDFIEQAFDVLVDELEELEEDDE